MKMNPLNFFLILFLTFILAFSQTTIDLNRLDSEYRGSNDMTFQVNFEDYSNSKDYIHFIIKPTSGRPSAFFSFTDQRCNAERTQMAFTPYDDLNLFIKKDEIRYLKTGYLCLTCITEGSCSYTIKVEKEDIATLEFGTHFKYFVNGGNTIMKFLFKVKSDTQIKAGSPIQMWVKGEKIQATDIYPIKMRDVEFDHGKAFYGAYENKTDYILTISAGEGDYIHIGSYFVENGVAKQDVRENDVEFIGNLNRGMSQLCYNIKLKEQLGGKNFYYFDGIIFKNKLKFFFKKNNGEEFLPDNITDGVLNKAMNLQQVRESQQICFGYIDQKKKSEEIVFSFTFINYLGGVYGQLIHPPQIPGYIYRHILLGGEVALFQGMITKSDATEINYNMKSLLGYSDMRFFKCTTFPKCKYGESTSDEDPNHTTRMTVKSFYLKDEQKITTISAFQPLLVVKCQESSDSGDFNSCRFETSIFTNRDRLILEENDAYSQYLLELEEDLYSIDFETVDDKDIIYLDLIIFSGDVTLEMQTNIKANKYYLANKIFYSIHLKGNNLRKKMLNFRVIAYKKSFYTIQYQMVKEGEENSLVNKIESRVNYLESVSVGETGNFTKVIEFENYNQLKQDAFLVSFYSLNCKFYVFRVQKENEFQEVEMIDNYGQDIIEYKDEYHNLTRFKYKVIVQQVDITEYNKQNCMLYVSGFEINESPRKIYGAISLSENVPHYYGFSKEYPAIVYVFHLADRDNVVVINFNLIDKAQFIVKIKIGYGEEKEKESIIKRNSQIFLDKNYLKQCEEDEVCQIYITIQMEKEKALKRVETTVYNIKSAPAYLPKNVMTQDILINDENKYFYFDIGKEEYGDIKIDYRRGSGNIFATVVNKTGVEEDYNANWRGMYTFPSGTYESLRYEAYLRKILIGGGDTMQCENGCYVLITVRSTTNPSLPDEMSEDNITLSRITITPKIIPRLIEDFKDMPIIRMQVNEFVIGNIYETSEDIYEFYSVRLPYDSEVLTIDWQADGCYLYLKFDEEKPNITNNQFDFEYKSLGYKTVYKLEKDEIKKKLAERDIQITSLKYLYLTLGIYTSKTDSVFTSMYAFRISMPLLAIDPSDINSKLAGNILHIRSDQKVQCNPQNKDHSDNYECLFAVVFDAGDIGKSLLVYPKGENENIAMNYYASLVDSDPIESNNIDGIKNIIPQENNAQYSTTKGPIYIYVEKIEKNKCLLIHTITNMDENIEVLSTIMGDEEYITPNPATPQVFGVNLKEGKKSLELRFDTTQNLLINIAGISGEGYFKWDEMLETNKTYNLFGFEDRLTLTSFTSNEDFKIATLTATSKDFSFSELEDKSFVFYITYYPRAETFNLDMVKEGRSTEFNYREVKFPLNYYSLLSGDNIAVSFNFYGLFAKGQISSEKNILTIWGKIVDADEIAESRMLSRPVVNSTGAVYGVFDGAFGILTLNKADIDKYQVQDKKRRFYFSVEINKEIALDIEGASIEVTVLKQMQSGENQLYTSEHVYYNGKLSKDNTEYRYKLKTSSKTPYMAIEFATNGELVQFAFGPYEEAEKNKNYSPEELEKIQRNGKYIISFKVNPETLVGSKTLYFNVFIPSGKDINPKLCNYIFKYMNSKQKNYFDFFSLDNDKVKYEIVQSKDSSVTSYKLTFTPSVFLQTSYYIKLVYKDSVIEGEEKKTIAMSESEGKYIEIDNPDVDITTDLSLTVEGVNKPVSYIKILARMRLDSLSEYVLYEPVLVGEADEEPHGDTVELAEKDEVQVLNYNKDKRQIIGNLKKAKKIQRYQLNFEKEEDKPDYIKVQVETSTNLTQVIYFSPTDPNGKENRLQIGQTSLGKNVTMWIKKEQFSESGYKLYTTVECQEESCGYRILYSGYNAVQYDQSAFVHNYYVSNNNTEMLFRIKNDFKIYEMFGEALTIYVTGSKFVNLTLKDCVNSTCAPFSFLGGVAITIDLPKLNYIDLIVNAEGGDYISVGSKVTFKEGLSFTNELIPNNYPISGFLKKGVLEKECYKMPLSKLDIDTNYYLSITFYLENAGIYYLDENLEILEPTRQIIRNGYYSNFYSPASDDRYFCIYIPKDDEKTTFENIVYTIQLTEPKDMKAKGLSNIYAPQISGFIYPRIIPAGTAVYFNSIYDTIFGKETIFNTFSVKGIPKMYMLKCKNFPFCGVDYETIDKNPDAFLINEINSMNTYHTNNSQNSTPISPEQYVMVVKCVDVNEYVDDYCEFQTSIFGNNDTVFLLENQPFSQYILKNEYEGFFIDFSGRKQVKRIYVDTLVLSGDVSFEFFDYHKKEEFDAHKYYVGNKIFYSITVDSNIEVPIIYAIMKAKLNSYYIIDYRIVTSDEEQLVNTIYSGANYLVPIPILDGVSSKEIKIQNKNLLRDSQYLVNFQSLNCRFNVRQKLSDYEYEDIPSYRTFAQKLIQNSEEAGELSTHTFSIEITEKDTTKYNTNFCMLYASGLEITKDVPVERDLLLGEAISQKVKFDENLKKIRYVYPLMNNTKNAVIDFKMNIHALFNLTLLINGQSYESQLFSRDIIYFLHYQALEGKCKANEICHIAIIIEFKESYEQGIFPILETMIRQTRNVPYYVPKDVAYRDFVSGDVRLYLYTDLGKGEQGYITANLDRGSGQIFANIVPIGEISNNTEPDWRNYTFPKDNKESLKYNFNEKKIRFDNIDTAKCEKGCYLLITLQNSVSSDFNDEVRLYHLTLTIHVDKVGSDYVEGRSIQIEPEQYIIGSFNDFDRMNDKKMYDYYEITIPYDVQYIQFDWQATTPKLFVNKGTVKPTKENANYKFDYTSGDIVLIINKNTSESWANQIFTIGVYGEDIETITGTKYSFRVHLFKKLNIHKVSQDQKTVCNPEKRDNKYSCLFMITYEYLQFFNDVMLFAKSQSNSASIEMYGKFINKTKYEQQKDDEILQSLPTKENTEFNKGETRDFIFATLGKDHMNLFVNVLSDERYMIEFMSSFKTFDTIMQPNPTGCQVFSMAEKSHDITLHIPTTKGLFINFVSIYGSGKIKLYNDNKFYNIRGRDDRLSFAVPQSKEDTTIIYIENANYVPSENEFKETIKDYPGFAFYIEYKLRAYDNVNYDEISFGKTTEISYMNSGFPFYYYARLNKFDSNINAFFTFHDLEYNKPEEFKREIRTSEFEVESTIVELKKIFPGVLDYQKIPQPHQIFNYDFYDPAIFTGQVNYLQTEFNDIVPEKDFPTFFFGLKQVNNGTDRIQYNRIRMEMTLTKDNDDSITTEKMYQYGVLFFNEAINKYKLKVDGKEGYMRIEFSPGTEYIDIAISDDNKNTTKNYTEFTDRKWLNGKYVITFKKPPKDFIYLKVFLKKNAPHEALMLLNSYAFKYINSPNKEGFYEYKTKDSSRKIEVKSEKKKNSDLLSFVGVTFSPINLEKRENVSVIYTLKVVEELPNELSGEIFDSIALKYYEGVVKHENITNTDNKISIKVNDVDKGYHYAQVIAQIRDGPIIEYFSYQPYMNPDSKNRQEKPEPGRTDESGKNNTEEDDDSTAIYVVVGISIALLVIVVVLVIIIMTFNSKNKDLMTKVNNISFVDKDNEPKSINDNEDANSDLLMNPKNELE